MARTVNGLIHEKPSVAKINVDQVAVTNMGMNAAPSGLGDNATGNVANGSPVLLAVEDSGEAMAMGEVKKFIIPDEGEENLIDEEELDIEGDMVIRIRKPGRNEFFKLLSDRRFTTNILHYKPNPESMDESMVYVDKPLQGKIAQDLHSVKFYICFSRSSQRFFIWPIKFSNTEWYRSLEVLLRKPAEFFLSNAIRVKSDKEKGRYRILYRPDSELVEWPVKSTDELVTEAIGPDNIITSPDHTIYVELTAGAELK